ncbi:hypothetical protein [Photobacterium sanctipauli]|nr:hypothetical protein [Photobacterium sanctipauli]
MSLYLILNQGHSVWMASNGRRKFEVSPVEAHWIFQQMRAGLAL